MYTEKSYCKTRHTYEHLGIYFQVFQIILIGLFYHYCDTFPRFFNSLISNKPAQDMISDHGWLRCPATGLMLFHPFTPHEMKTKFVVVKTSGLPASSLMIVTSYSPVRLPELIVGENKILYKSLATVTILHKYS